MSVLVDDHDFVLYEADVLDMLTLFWPDGVTVDAVVTSPPYMDARADIDWGSPHGYGDWCASWLAALLPVVTSSGSLMLNLGRLHRDGEERDYWIDVLARARNVGWYWLDTIVWDKVNGGGGRASPYLIDRHEYVFWLARAVDPYKGFDEARQPYSPATLARYQRRWGRRHGAVKGSDTPEVEGREAHPGGAKPGSVFRCSVGAEKGIEHPTPMAPELAEFLVKLSCPGGGTVLDPFLGSGTTGRACRKLGRRCIGVERDPRWAQEAAGRLAQQSLLSGGT